MIVEKQKISSLDGYSFDVFLSHSSEDIKSVNRLHRRLEKYSLPKKNSKTSAGVSIKKRKLKVFHYVEDAPLNDSLKSSMDNIISEIDKLIICVSKDSLINENVCFEIDSFFKYHSRSTFHIVVVNDFGIDEYKNVILNQFDDEPVYVNLKLASCGWLNWVLLNKWQFNRLTIPLLAKLFNVKPQDLVDREKKRRKNRLIAISATFFLVMASFFSFYFSTEPYSWMQTDAEQIGHPIKRAKLGYFDGNEETIRVLSYWQPFYDDIIPAYTGTVMELDTNGNKTGELTYEYDAGGDLHFFPANQTTSEIGTLIDEAKSLQDTIWSGDVIYKITDIDYPGLIKANREVLGLDYDPTDKFDSIAKTNFPKKSKDDISILLNSKKFVLNADLIIVFAEIYSDNQDFDGALAMSSSDNGLTWNVGTFLPGIDANNLSSCYIVDESRGSYLIAFAGDSLNWSMNYLIYSNDGLNWNSLTIPTEWIESNYVIEQAVMAEKNSNVIAVMLSNALIGTNFVNTSRIMISKDKGISWDELSVGLPENTQVSLIGVSDRGQVIGFIPNGKLLIYRRRTIIERFRDYRGLNYTMNERLIN